MYKIGINVKYKTPNLVRGARFLAGLHSILIYIRMNIGVVCRRTLSIPHTQTHSYWEQWRWWLSWQRRAQDIIVENTLAKSSLAGFCHLRRLDVVTWIQRHKGVIVCACVPVKKRLLFHRVRSCHNHSESFIRFVNGLSYLCLPEFGYWTRLAVMPFPMYICEYIYEYGIKCRFRDKNCIAW